MHTLNDTIAAIATAHSPAALGIVRISGPLAETVLYSVTKRKKTIADRRVSFGIALDPKTNELIDEIVYFFCKGPRTATGEDIAELQGHGGPLIMKRLLEAALHAGARPAEPGEFTYRAFVNGRIDLTQAEAVMGLIAARSDRAARVSLGQLSGKLGNLLRNLFEEVSSVTANIEAGLDFPDEDLSIQLSNESADRLKIAVSCLRELAESFVFGSRLTDGVRIAVVGPPNAGKSSLFNLLASEDRAIVDDTPGTTRDVLEFASEINGIPVVYSDTAGLRDVDVKAERIGIERSVKTAEASDILLLILDGTASFTEQNLRHLNSLLCSSVTSNKLVAINKKDLPGFKSDLPNLLSLLPHVSISAFTGEGIENLLAALSNILNTESHKESVVLTTARQHRAVSEAANRAETAANMLLKNGELELVAAELKWARESLAALLGKSADEEMLNLMFSNFCIGK